MVYIRMIGVDYFEYLVVYKNQVYSSYILISPVEGKKKLTKGQINQCMALINSGAEATVDTLVGDKISKEDEEKVALVEKYRDAK